MVSRHASRFVLAAALAAALLAIPVDTRAADAGSIGGVAKWDGPAPNPSMVQMKADPKCLAMHGGQDVAVEEVVVSSAGEIQNVFLYVTNPPKDTSEVPSTPAVLGQKGCAFVPHVQGMRLGQMLNIVNEDETMHNVRSISKVNSPVNIAQPQPGTREKKFGKPEFPVKFKCDVHPWMTGYVFVMDHPYYAVSDAKGAYEITGLPPGEYTVIAWHEKYGKQESKVTVATGKSEANFTFAPAQKK